MELLPHQEVSKQFLLSKGRCILADEPRVGKTLATASAALQHLPALVICPAIVKTVWQSAFTN
jgi:SNF2 family DNA or RNA helicase